jgi:hypothetical protein
MKGSGKSTMKKIEKVIRKVVNQLDLNTLNKVDISINLNEELVLKLKSKRFIEDPVKQYHFTISLVNEEKLFSEDPVILIAQNIITFNDIVSIKEYENFFKQIEDFVADQVISYYLD